MVTVPCNCPPAADGSPRHPDGDTVELRERLGFRDATAIRFDISVYRATLEESGNGEASVGEVLAVLSEGYVLYGVTGWTFVDELDKPLAVNRPNIRARILEDWDVAALVSDAADDLYAEAVMHPLLRTGSPSSRRSPTNASTSPSPSSPTELPTPSKPSSTSTTPTDDIETTTGSLDGGSKSSRKSATAA